MADADAAFAKAVGIWFEHNDLGEYQRLEANCFKIIFTKTRTRVERNADVMTGLVPSVPRAVEFTMEWPGHGI